MEQLYKFIIFEIFKNLSIEDVKNMCIINKKFKQITRKYIQSNFMWNLNYLFRSPWYEDINIESKMDKIINLDDNFVSFLFFDRKYNWEIKKKIKNISSIFNDNGFKFTHEIINFLYDEFDPYTEEIENIDRREKFKLIFTIKDKYVDYEIFRLIYD